MTSGCTGNLSEYGDSLSIMGNAGSGFPGVGQLEKMGLVPQTALPVYDQVGSYSVVLTAVSEHSGYSAAKIPYSFGNAAAGMDGIFYVELRDASSEPTYSDGTQMLPGVQVRYIPTVTAAGWPRTWLIPLSTGAGRYSLPVGSSWTDPNGAFIIQTVSTDQSLKTATISIAIAKAPKKVHVTTQPSDVSYAPGERVYLYAAGSGYPEAPTAQWQRYASSTGAWEDMPGETSDTLTIPTFMGDGNDGASYRVVYTGNGSEEPSMAATLNAELNGRPVIYNQLPDVTVGAWQYFPVTAALSGGPFTQAYVYVSGVGAFQGYTDQDGVFQASAYADAGSAYYYLNVRNAAGLTQSHVGHISIVPVDACTIRLNTPLASGNMGDTVELSTLGNTQCAGAAVQWQRRLGGGSWADISGASGTDSGSGATYTRVLEASDHLAHFRAVYSLNGTATASAGAVVEVADGCSFITHPASVEVAVGDTAAFEVELTPGCDGYGVQWQEGNVDAGWTDILGEAGLSYERTVASTDQGIGVRARLSMGTHILDSHAGVVNIATCVYVNPTSAAGSFGDEVTFIGASGVGCTIRWQTSTDRGSSWQPIAGSTDLAYVHTISPGDNGIQFRAIQTLESGQEVATPEATLAVTECLGWVNEVPVYADPGTSPFIGRTDSSGCENYTVAWQKSTDFMATWSTISGATGFSYTPTVGVSDDATYFRALLTYGGVTFTTGTQLLRVNVAQCEIIRGLEDVLVEYGQSSSHSYFATTGCANVATARIEILSPNGPGWQVLFTDVATSGEIAISPAYDHGSSGSQMRVVYTIGGADVFTDPSTWKMRTGCAFEKMPGQEMTSRGSFGTFETFANTQCAGYTQSWERSVDGGQSWTVVATASSESKHIVAQMVGSASTHNTLYRSRLTKESLDPVISSPGLLKVSSWSPPIVTLAPIHMSVRKDSNSALYTQVIGQAYPSAQWQVRESPTSTMTNVYGSIKPTLWIPTEEVGSRQYRAVFTNQAGSVTTDTVTVTVYEPLTITSHPEDDVVVMVGESAVWSVGFSSGSSAGYSGWWERSDDYGESWQRVFGISPLNGDDYELTAAEEDNGTRVRACFLESSTGDKTCSNEGSLTVTIPGWR
jgi:hypothetical protein